MVSRFVSPEEAFLRDMDILKLCSEGNCTRLDVATGLAKGKRADQYLINLVTERLASLVGKGFIRREEVGRGRVAASLTNKRVLYVPTDEGMLVLHDFLRAKKRYNGLEVSL